jgi:hypothetical protein
VSQQAGAGRGGLLQVLGVQRAGVLEQANEEIQAHEADAVEDAHAVHDNLAVICRHGEIRLDARRHLRHEQHHLWQRVAEDVPPAWDGLEQEALLDVACLVVEDLLVCLDDVVPDAGGELYLDVDVALGGAGGALYSEVDAEASASKVGDFEDDEPRENGEAVRICSVVVEIARVVLIYISTMRSKYHINEAKAHQCSNYHHRHHRRQNHKNSRVKQLVLDDEAQHCNNGRVIKLDTKH